MHLLDAKRNLLNETHTKITRNQKMMMESRENKRNFGVVKKDRKMRY